MKSEKIPEFEWQDFFNSFSKQHLKWHSYIEVLNSHGSKQIISDNKPLKKIFVSLDGSKNSLTIVLDSSEEIESDYKINNIEEIFLEEQEGIHKGLKIITSEGNEVYLRFRSALPTDMLEGIVR
jgi:hypothetical protein